MGTKQVISPFDTRINILGDKQLEVSVRTIIALANESRTGISMAFDTTRELQQGEQFLAKRLSE